MQNLLSLLIEATLGRSRQSHIRTQLLNETEVVLLHLPSPVEKVVLLHPPNLADMLVLLHSPNLADLLVLLHPPNLVELLVLLHQLQQNDEQDLAGLSLTSLQ